MLGGVLKFGSAAVIGALALGVFGGCSSGTTCDPTQCLQKNQCVKGYANYDDAVKADPTVATTECRLVCTAPTDCPFNYHCVGGGTTEAGTVSYCVKDRTPAFLGKDFTAASSGEAAAGAPWGVPCDPTKGLDSNTDCSTTESFWCYGTSPTDANAFCTQFQCGDDGDCPGGWWCNTVNDQPSVTGGRREDWGKAGTIAVCMPRAYNTKPGSYCAPCKSDVDCPKNEGAAQHCTAADGASAKETVCAAECTDDKNCPFDQACMDAGLSSKVCLPRAATCKGDGSFCSPCHSDVDCDPNGGFCVAADYSTEHFCTAPTPTCTYNSTSGFTDTCPALPDTAKPPNSTTDGVGCSYSAATNIPIKQCYGGNTFGLGCHTYHCSGTGGTCFQNSDCCSNLCNTAQQTCN